MGASGTRPARAGARGTSDAAAGAGTAARGEDARAVLGERAYRVVAEALRREEGFDLAFYRSSYLARRLRARLGAVRLPPDAYASRVASDADERRALMETLGVNVSGFFRDPAVWQFLEESMLPPLVAARAAAGETLRAVSLGCATGEEAYGIAMVLSELTRGVGSAFRVDAFDVDPAALRTAAAGRYPDRALAPLSRASRERYFEPLGDGRHEVGAELRRAVRVARRDVLTEPLPGPYDLVLCRNVLIYVDGPAKDLFFRKLHAALADDGLLVLGQSEVVLGQAAELFSSLSSRHRVYRRGGAR